MKVIISAELGSLEWKVSLVQVYQQESGVKSNFQEDPVSDEARGSLGVTEVL